MSKVSRDELLTFLRGELPAAEQDRIEQVILSDPATEKLFDDLALGMLFPPQSQTVEDSSRQPRNEDEQNFSEMVQSILHRASRAEYWSLESIAGQELHTLLHENDAIAVSVKRLAGDVNGVHEDVFQARIERLSVDPLRFWLSSDEFPIDYELLCVALTRLEHLEREPLPFDQEFDHLKELLDERPTLPKSHQTGQRTDARAESTGVLSADSGPDSRRKTKALVPHSSGDFKVKVNPETGVIDVQAKMPLYQGDDIVIGELSYADTGGNLRTKCQAMLLKPSPQDRRWSSSTRFDVPDLDDHQSAQVQLCFRSLRDSDLYLLKKKRVEELLAIQDWCPLDAQVVDGGFEFGTHWNFAKEAAADPTVCWTLQVARREGGQPNV